MFNIGKVVLILYLRVEKGERRLIRKIRFLNFIFVFHIVNNNNLFHKHII